MKDTLTIVLLTVAISLVYSQNENTPSPCLTPENANGVCVNIRRCESLLTLLRTSSSKPSVVAFLRQSQCGTENNDPLVCCPLTRNNEDTAGPREGNPEFPSNVPAPPSCGFTDVTHTRIVGGSEAKLGGWPWIVVYGYRSRRAPNAPFQWLCGGALVTAKHTVTAAHCTQHPSLSMFVARMGELSLDPNVTDGANPVDVATIRAIRHPEYNSGKFLNDIAIVVLQSPVKFTTHITPICLPFGSEVRRDLHVKKTPFVAGWGAQQFKGAASKALLEIQIPVVDNAVCAEKYAKVGSTITSRQICAGGQVPKDACQGDSGGPMMLPKGKYYYLIGVVSYGYRCAEPGYPGVYTRVAEYLDWLRENLN